MIDIEQRERLAARQEQLMHELPVKLYGGNLVRLVRLTSALAEADLAFHDAIDAIAYEERADR